MHDEHISDWVHDHRFETGSEAASERKTKAVVAITALMMIAEIIVGLMTNSMALLADGFHMATHTFALGIAAFAYWYARKHATDLRYSFGTGKVGVLAAFTSAIILLVVVVFMLWESGARLLTKQNIAFDDALWVAIIGLAVNVVCALILGHDHDHDHRHEHDHNINAAYIHVIADAFTSVLAIVALLFGKYFGWWWLDPLMGIVGAIVITKWALNLIRRSGGVLLDKCDDDELEKEVRAIIEANTDNRLSDLHLWQVGPGHWAAIVSVVTNAPLPPQHYRNLLSGIHELSHVTIEIHANN